MVSVVLPPHRLTFYKLLYRVTHSTVGIKKSYPLGDYSICLLIFSRENIPFIAREDNNVKHIFCLRWPPL